MPEARVHLFIEGRVQGVFYRGYTSDTAARLGLTGWVMNLRDGRVEAVFEGDKVLIEQAIQACRKGPPGSHVTDIDVEWEEYTGTIKGFEVRYY